MKRWGGFFTILILSMVLVACAPAAASAPNAVSSAGAASAVDPIQGIEDVLAALGIFAAFMLVLALGTEAVIDAFKLLIGFKSKPTALDALNQMKTWLPQQMEQMGTGEAMVQKLGQTLDRLSQASITADQSARAALALKKWLAEISLTSKTKPIDLASITSSLASLETQLKTEGVLVENIAQMKEWALGVASTVYLGTVQQMLEFSRSVLQRIGVADEAQQKAVYTVLEAWILHYLPDWLGFADPGRTKSEQVPKADLLTLNAALAELKNKLANLLSEPQFTQLSNWLLASITALQPAEDTTALAAIKSLLQTVEQRREEIQSPLRKLWRWFKRKLKVQLTLSKKLALKEAGFWNRLWLWVLRLFESQVTLRPERQILSANPVTLASVLLARNDAHRDEELSRLRWLRLVSIGVGFYLALWLQIDAGSLLADILPPTMLAIVTRPWFMLGGLPVTPGIIVSAFAASAGATFWHDILDRLQTSKKAVGEVKDMLSRLRELESKS